MGLVDWLLESLLVIVGAGVVVMALSGHKCKKFNSGMEGQENFLRVTWDVVDDDVNHRWMKETCLAGHKVCLSWDRGGSWLGSWSSLLGSVLGLQGVNLDLVPITVGGWVGVGVG